MAKGRRDYTWGVLQDAILPGRYSVNWFDSLNLEIDAFSNNTLILYTVPLGYKFFLTGVFITCFSPQMNLITLYKDDVAFLLKYFSVGYDADLASLGSYVFNAAEELKIIATNYDAVDVWFSCQAFGVLEELV